MGLFRYGNVPRADEAHHAVAHSGENSHRSGVHLRNAFHLGWGVERPQVFQAIHVGQVQNRQIQNRFRIRLAWARRFAVVLAVAVPVEESTINCDRQIRGDQKSIFAPRDGFTLRVMHAEFQSGVAPQTSVWLLVPTLLAMKRRQVESISFIFSASGRSTLVNRF